jgi:hypothetical protein
MDPGTRAITERHLAQAERHVREGEQRLEHQRAIIDERRRDGHDVELSEQLLAEMEESQRLHVAERDRLRAELAAPAERRG